ncbi:MAG: hypothetical protein AAGA67_11565 [Cyanobacteria bacterium P01_F01_bin.153]
MAGLYLNLGCGSRLMDGYVNVDKYGSPDLKLDLETFPWPWDSNSVAKIEMIHVLEHLGQHVDIYRQIIQEIYRISQPQALVHIVVPHHRHDDMLHDPTHVRTITPMGLNMFSQALNRQWQESGAANTPLGTYWEVDFELKETRYVPSELWDQWKQGRPGTDLELLQQGTLYNNLIREVDMTLVVIK